MAVGKQKGKGKRGKKVVNVFDKKDWYNLRAPAYFQHRAVGKTLVTRTQGNKIASEGLMGRVYEVSLADLQNDEEQAYRKIKLCCEEVQGNNCLLNFHGMSFTRDQLCYLIKKWQTLIECNTDVRTTDGYTLRLFCIGFTNRRREQQRKTSYATGAQVRRIRAKMGQIMQQEANCELKDLVQKFIPEVIGKAIEAACNGIYPITNVFIRKAKVLKKPKFDLVRLMEVHGNADNAPSEHGADVDREEEPAVEAMEGSGGRL
jgi:small subunit ribosomal protein S3Ae